MTRTTKPFVISFVLDKDLNLLLLLCTWTSDAGEKSVVGHTLGQMNWRKMIICPNIKSCKYQFMTFFIWNVACCLIETVHEKSQENFHFIRIRWDSSVDKLNLAIKYISLCHTANQEVTFSILISQWQEHFLQSLVILLMESQKWYLLGSPRNVNFVRSSSPAQYNERPGGLEGEEE